MIDVLWGICMVLSGILTVWLLIRRIIHKDWYPRTSLRRDTWSMAFLWGLALLVGSTEQFFDWGTTIRVGFALAAVLTTISVMFRPPEDWVGDAELRSRSEQGL